MTQEDWSELDDAAQALDSALELIGEPGKTDHDLAKIVCDHELGLRKIVNFVLMESTRAAQAM